MIVKVSLFDTSFDISVGNGHQTFKWLASVIQARINKNKKLLKKIGDTSYIVTEIRNTFDELLNPSDMIFEHAGPSGVVVTAITSTVFPVDEWENPEPGDWMKGAYVQSKAGKHWTIEIDAWRESLKQLKVEHKGEEVDYDKMLTQRFEPQSATTFIKIGFDFSESDINSAFNLDWNNMKWSWLKLSDSERNATGDTLKKSYALICHVFAHFCGIGQVGQRYGLTIHDFAHFLHFMKIYNIKSDFPVIQEAYYKSGDLNPASFSSNKWPLMTRSHLSQALVYVAVENQLSTTPAASLRAFIEGPISKFWSDITGRYLYYTLGDENLKRTTLEYYQLLKQSFESKSTMTHNGPKLHVVNFVEMLIDSTMIEPEQESSCVKGFLGSHLDPSLEWELDEMVLSEFIEALSRVSMRIIEGSSGLNDAKKIRMAFNFVTELLSVSGSSPTYRK